LRITRRVAVFGFPCGRVAFETDKTLFDCYLRRKREPPVWLAEHMQYPFPEPDLFHSLGDDWQALDLPNENLDFHSWMMRKEMNSFWNLAFQGLLKCAPALVRNFLRRQDTEPCYRRLFIVSRQPISGRRRPIQ